MDMKQLLISGALISGLSFGSYGEGLHVGKHKLKPIVQDPIVEDYNCGCGKRIAPQSIGYSCNVCQGVCETVDTVVGYAAEGTYNTVSGIYNESGALLGNVHRGVGNITRGLYDTVTGVACGEGCCDKIQGFGRGVGNTILSVGTTVGYVGMNTFNIATTPVKAFLARPLSCLEEYCGQ